VYSFLENINRYLPLVPRDDPSALVAATAICQWSPEDNTCSLNHTAYAHLQGKGLLGDLIQIRDSTEQCISNAEVVESTGSSVWRQQCRRESYACSPWDASGETSLLTNYY
jgi:hypothetical protein